MHTDGIWLAAAALGHGCLFIWLLNVTHALGLRKHALRLVSLLLLLAWLAASAGLMALVTRSTWPDWPLFSRAYAVFCAFVALAVVPAGTIVLRLQRTPRGIASTGERLVLSETSRNDSFIGKGPHAWMLRLPRNESLGLRALEWSVELPGLPRACDGLSIVQLSDLHFAPCYDWRYFEAVAEAAASFEADLVLVTGDLVDDERAIEWIEPVLSRLRGRLGQFAILGNHDFALEPARIMAAVESAGFTSLEGRWTDLNIGGETLALGGTSEPWGERLDFSAESAADVRLLMSHTPDNFPRAAAAGIDLLLAGHNHGGQVRLPVVGPVFMPSRYSRRYARGFYKRGRSIMYVSQGIGGKHPLRYGCPPEIARFVLRAPSRFTSAQRGGAMHRLPAPHAHTDRAGAH